MKIECSDDNYVVFLNYYFIKDISFTNKEDMIKFIKMTLYNFISKDILVLNGFYKVKVYPNNRLGVFIELERQEDFDLSEGVDFRINIYFNNRFLLEFDDYFLIDKKNVIIFNDKYYVDCEDLSDIEIITLSDNYNIIYGKEINSILKNGKRL